MGPVLILLLALCASEVTLAYNSFSIGPIATSHNLTKRNVGQAVNPRKVKIKYLHVESRIEHRFASTKVSSKLSNSAYYSQEVHFFVAIPETAFISGFKMYVDERMYEAYVKNKTSALEEYRQGVARNQTAAHIAASVRDSKVFDISVNVEARKKIVFYLTYDELLTRKLGVYNLAINIDPGQVVPSMIVNVHIKETRKITVLRVPKLRSGHQVDADNTTRGNDLVVITRTSPHEAHVFFSPTREQQERIGHISDDPQTNSIKSLKAQFVVQYDVERDSGAGEILIQDGYFVHFFAPNNLPTMSKHASFVLDVSGSMRNGKLTQLKEAMKTILDNLNEGDYFNIIEFSSGVKVWNLDSMNESYMSGWSQKGGRGINNNRIYRDNGLRTPAFPATREYISAAKRHINMMSASGGTNIYEALKTAIRVAHVGLENVPFICGNPQPIILLLTDGLPTYKTPDEIIACVDNYNQNPKAAIFSLAFGDDADLNFLKKLSLRNSGSARKIYADVDAADQLRDFYRQIESPLLANITFNYRPEQAIMVGTTSMEFPSLFLGSELVVAAKISKTMSTETDVYYIKGDITSVTNSGVNTTNVRILVSNHQAEKPGRVSSLEKLWAYLTIKQLIEKDVSTSTNELWSGFKRSALELALQYSFVTPLTSLVVVKPDGSEEDGIKDEPEIKQTSTHRVEDDNDWSDLQGVMKPPLRSPAPSNGGVMQPNTVGGSCCSHLVPRIHFNLRPTLLGENVNSNESDDFSDESSETMQPLALIPLADLEWLHDVRRGSNVTLPFGTYGQNQEYLFDRSPDTQLVHPFCLSPVSEGVSVCEHLMDCPLNVFKHDVQIYRKYFCDMNDFAGVCCPSKLSKSFAIMRRRTPAA